MSYPYVLDRLGSASRGNRIMSVHRGRHPRTDSPIVMLSMSRGGFVVVDPKSGDTQYVRSEIAIDTGWALAQGPDGDIWYTGAGYGPQSICRWDWSDEGGDAVAREVAIKPGKWTFTIGVGPDGYVYLPECVDNVIERFDPVTGTFGTVVDASPFGKRARDIACAADGWVYCTSTTYPKGSTIFCFDAGICEPRHLQDEAGNDLGPIGIGGPVRLDDGTVVVLRRDEGSDDAPVRAYVVRAGRVDAQPLEPSPICQVTQGSSPIQFGQPMRALAFDGIRVESIIHDTMTVLDEAADGGEPTRRTFRFPWVNRPLRQFSITSGADRVWLGTFIPLTLNCYDPASGLSQYLGNPTSTDGEIYNMTFSRGRLFMGSYTQAALTVYDPRLPWRITGSAYDNPRQLGLMKEEGLPLHRPHGIAKDQHDNVYFAAVGDYGCEDSGICRIDPDTLDVTRWLYPQTAMQALVHLDDRDLLLVSEQRRSETVGRFTLVDPRDGRVTWSDHVIHDPASIHSWLHLGGDLVYGMHASRGTLFAFNLRTKRIEHTLPEMGVGIPCYNALIEGPDGRVWGLTNEVVFAADLELSKLDIITRYTANPGNSYRFGMTYGPDGHLYFADNTELMRLRTAT